MAAPLAVGAGASEGLDTMLNRMMVQQEVDERSRHNQATEDLASRGLDQQDEVRKSLAELRDAQKQGLADKQADATKRQGNMDALLADPSVDPKTKIALRMYGALPEGDKTFSPEMIPGLGKPAAAKSLQTHFADIDITDNGVPKHLKNVPVQVNPDPADPYVQFNGQRLNPENVHGITSPSMAVAGLQWDPTAGLLIDKGKRTATTITGPDGVVQPQLTSSSRTMKEGAQALLPHIKDISSQADALEKDGLFGPVMSRVREMLNHAGSVDEFYDLLNSDPQLGSSKDERVGKFASSLGLLASGAARVHYGGRGGSNSEAYGRFKAMLSDAGTPNLFKGHIGALNDYMQGYANMGTQPGGGAGADAGPDLYQQYLNRPKK